MIAKVREDREQRNTEQEAEKGLWLDNTTKQIREFSKMIFNDK